MQEEVTFAGLAFIFMSFILAKTPVLDRLIDILNSFLGRLRGGRSTPPLSRAACSVPSPTSGPRSPQRSLGHRARGMKTLRRQRELSATVVAGCAGMGVTFPFSATMFILVGSSTVTGMMAADDIIVPLAIAGLWCLGYRLVLSYYLVRKNGLQPIAPEDRIPVKRSLRVAGPRCCCSSRS